MQRIINKKVFMDIFKDKELRYKLDKMILEFFGLDNSKVINNKDIEEDKIIEFVVLINTEIVLRIKVIDNKELFKTFRSILINFSYLDVDKHYEILMPGFIDIYCIYNYNHLNKCKNLLLIGALLNCKTIDEVKNVLNSIKIFDEKDVEKIVSMLPLF